MNFERLVEKVRDNDVVLWVGAGFSLYAGIPSANTLRNLFIENSTEEEKVYFENKGLAETAETFINLRKGSRNELYKLLQSVIDIEPKSLQYHRLISEIPQISLIVTTNYDRLFEEAYGREISPIINDIQIPLATKRTQLFKIHGDIHMPDTIILTDSDYTDFYRNQDKPIWNKIKTLIAEKTIVFLGYSLSDQNINYLYDNVITSVGKFQKEAYLISPDLPQHEVSRITQKNIQYINMTGEDFAVKLHEEITKHFLEDIMKNRIDKEYGLSFLENKHSLKATIQSTSKGSYINSLGSPDKTKSLSLNVKFQGVDFFQLLRESSFRPFEISGEKIISMNSDFEGISIPSEGKVLSVKIIPLPLNTMIVDLYFKGKDMVLTDVRTEIFEGFSKTIIRFIHKSIEFEFNFENKVFHFKFKKFQRLKDLEEILDFLLELIKGEEPLVVFIKETSNKSRNTKNKEFELVHMNSSENIEITEELIEIRKIVTWLKDVQSHYRINFRDFEFNLSSEIIKIFDILKLHMSKKPIKLSKLYFTSNDIIFYEDTANPKKTINDMLKDKQPMFFESRKKIGTISLFNQEIEINDDLVIKCKDSILKEVEGNDGNTENINLEIVSAKEGIVMGFLKDD